MILTSERGESTVLPLLPTPQPFWRTSKAGSGTVGRKGPSHLHADSFPEVTSALAYVKGSSPAWPQGQPVRGRDGDFINCPLGMSSPESAAPPQKT